MLVALGALTSCGGGGGGNNAVEGPIVVERVSVDSAGAEANDSSFDTAISADGRYVAFKSQASNLVANDSNAINDIFVRDMQSGTTTRASVDSSGVEANNLNGAVAISADGRYVAFTSSASNLVANDTTLGNNDVFVRDTQSNTTTRVSVDSADVEQSGSSDFVAISGDGRFVAFNSGAANLVVNDNNGSADVFVRDTQLNTTTRVSVDSSGIEANGASAAVAISADGRYVAFASFASNLVANDTNGSADVFVRDTQLNTTTRVSVDNSGAQITGASSAPAISADGRYVAFLAANGFVQDVFVRDTQLNTTARASVSSSGAAVSSNVPSVAISGDGRYVAFASDAANLVPNDNNGQQDIFVRDMQSSTTTRFSVDPSGNNANGLSINPALSGDGRYVAFSSWAGNLVANDNNALSDIFRAHAR